MTDTDHGYGRGWVRYGFDTLDLKPFNIHSGAADLDFTVAFNRGPMEPQLCFMIIPPGTPQPAVGLHIHRDGPSRDDLEEWYVIIEGTGVMRFTNGDSVAFRSGDVLGVYPGTGHSVVAAGDGPVRLLVITPKMWTLDDPMSPTTPPETFAPRIRVLTTNEPLNPITAECSVCGARWEQPADDPASEGLPAWAAEHECTEQFVPLNA